MKPTTKVEIINVIDKALKKLNDTNSSTTRFNYTVDINETLIAANKTKQALQNNGMCSLFEKPCRVGYFCVELQTKSNDGAVCKKKCSTKNKPCGENGECFVHYKDEEIKCRCKETDSHVYSGKFCEIATEKLKLKTKVIVIIGAASGGALILIIAILSVCLVRVKLRNRRKKGKRYDDDRFKSVSMNDLHSVGLNDVPRSRTTTVQDSYDSGLPRTSMVDDRKNRLLKDRDSGSETYIYMPSFSNTNRDEYPSMRSGSVYDYIDTERKFEIQRPNVRSGPIKSYW